MLYSDYADALEAGPDWRAKQKTPLTDLTEGLRGVLLSEVCVQSSRAKAWQAFPQT